MGDSRLLTRFREFYMAYRAKYAFEGVVEGLQLLAPVEPEHLPRGMFVRGTVGPRFVQFESERMPPVAIGDTVVVVGLDGWRGENSVLPAVLLNPAERYAWFFGNLRHRTTCNMALQNTCVLFAVATGIFLIAKQIEPLREIWSYVLSLLFLIVALFAEPFVLKYNERPRLYHCDEQTWQALTSEVAERFGITPSV